VDAQGEVAALKDNINQMIANLRETTLKNSEQDWLKTNVARFTRMLQGQRDLRSPAQFRVGEGLVGQCALEKKRTLVSQGSPGLLPYYLQHGNGDADHHRGAAHPL
jgi:hypothetical protein